MGERPDGLTLGRKDNNKGYSHTNCQWESRAEQSLNKQNTVRVEYLGKTMLLKEACEVSGASYGHVTHLHSKLGITHQEAFGAALQRAVLVNTKTCQGSGDPL